MGPTLPSTGPSVPCAHGVPQMPTGRPSQLLCALPRAAKKQDSKASQAPAAQPHAGVQAPLEGRPVYSPWTMYHLL